MLVVTIELWPKGREENKQTLGKMYIANDGKGILTSSNYGAVIKKKNSSATWKCGYIKKFPRKILGPWDLLYRCLNACGIDKRN